MANIRIRRAEIADADGIAERIKGQNTPAQIREQIELFASKGWEHLVAVDDSGVIGNVAIVSSRYFPPDQPHRAELADVVVAPGHQGTGLLTRLVEAAVEFARERGVTQLETSAWASNERAVRAYSKVGFLEWGRLPNAVKHEDGSVDSLVCYVMEL